MKTLAQFVVAGLTVIGIVFGSLVCTLGAGELTVQTPAQQNSDAATVNWKRPPAGFVSIFDGYTLNGWRAVPTENIHDFSVVDGLLVATGSKDQLVYLVFREEPGDFELMLQYRMVTKGNSGVEVRSHYDTTGKRPFEGYHADIGHVGIGPQVLGAWDFHFAKRKEYDCKRGTRLVIHEDGSTDSSKIDGALTTGDLNKHGWNRMHIVARDRKLSFSINGKVASEFTDNKPERLKSGMFGLQIHDAGMVTEFKNIWLKRLDGEE